MTIRAPSILGTAIVTDDAPLAARLSSALGQRGSYLAVFDGPRMARPDADNEVVRRNNALARIEVERVLLCALSEDQHVALTNKLPKTFTQLCRHEDVEIYAPTDRIAKDAFVWGKKNIGVGLLNALNSGRLIQFSDDGPENPATKINKEHLVVCEAGNPLSEVIAANYAFALGANLAVIPEINSDLSATILERYYFAEAEEERTRLQIQLQKLCAIDIPEGVSVTFFTRKLPFGLAFPRRPSTHLFTYPDCGIAVANGFAAEQRDSRGVNVAVLVDPEKTPAPEIDFANTILPKRAVFVRGYRGKGASVRNVTDVVDHFPYDLLIFATHCGDASGWRWTYKFEDSERLERTLKVDLEIGIGHTDDPGKFEVQQFTKFHSLDGVDWNDPIEKSKLHVGTAIRDFTQMYREDSIKPVHKEEIDRVRWSAAMAMSDNNYIPMPRTLADRGTPIVINNACVSWHELAARFTFGSARAYVGTMYPVLPFEAESIFNGLVDKYWGKPLPYALWAAQRDTYGKTAERRPYVMTGVFTQKLRAKKEDVPRHIMQRLSQGVLEYTKLAINSTGEHQRKMQQIRDYYQNEAMSFGARWFPKT